jgi:hypothetical protein
MTENKKFVPYVIHGIDPGGVNIVTSGQNYAVKGVLLLPGMSLEVTEKTIDANRDRNGDCFLELTADEQRARWGAVRFGRGAEIPQHVTDALEARRIADLERERADIMYSGGLRGDGSKLARLQELNAELGVHS